MGDEQELRRVRGAQTICHLDWLIERAKEARGVPVGSSHAAFMLSV
jgi:hypothetical protein